MHRNFGQKSVGPHPKKLVNHSSAAHGERWTEEEKTMTGNHNSGRKRFTEEEKKAAAAKREEKKRKQEQHGRRALQPRKQPHPSSCPLTKQTTEPFCAGSRRWQRNMRAVGHVCCCSVQRRQKVPSFSSPFL